MKKTPFLATLLLALASLTSGSVFANSDYPAASFQPKVVYQDKEAMTEHAKTKAPAAKTEVDAKYPAASFQPKVVYSDDSAASDHWPVKVIKKEVPQTAFDPKYPAASFTPKVIYP